MFKPNFPLDFLVVQYLTGVPAKMAIEQAGEDCFERSAPCDLRVLPVARWALVRLYGASPGIVPKSGLIIPYRKAALSTHCATRPGVAWATLLTTSLA